MNNVKYFVKICFSTAVLLMIVLLIACTPSPKKTISPELTSVLPTIQTVHQNDIAPSLLAEWTIGNISDMAWSPDSHIFVVNYYLHEDEANNHIQAFNVAPPKKAWTAENSLAEDLIFTPDGQSIVESNAFLPILYWRNAEKGDVVRQIKSENCDGGQFVVASSGGNTVLIANTHNLTGLNANSTVIIQQWDLETGHCKDLLQYRGGFDLFDVNSNGKLLVFGGEGKDDSVVIWDIEKQMEVCRTPKVDFGRFLPNQNTLAVTRHQKIVFLDASTCQELRELNLAPTYLTYLAFSPDGQLLAVAQASIQIIDVSTGKTIAQIPFPKNAAPYSQKLFSGGIEFSPDGDYLLLAFSTGAYSGEIQLWRLLP